MKKILVTFLLLATCIVSAQKRWSVELGVGNHTIADEFVDVRDNFYHLDGVVRYSFNEKVGLGLYGGFDNLSVDNVNSGLDTDIDYYRISLQGVVDVFEILDLDNNTFTILTHGGFGFAKYDTNNGYNDVTPTFGGGITGLVHLSERFALKGDFSTTGHFNQRFSLDGVDRVTSVGMNSFITNSSVGLVVYLGKKSKGEHYDWYEEPVVDELAGIRDSLALLAARKPVVNLYQTVNECQCSTDENVYFENDLPKVGTTGEALIGIQGLNAIEKIANLAKTDSKLVIYLNGSASPTTSTTKQYDLDLSERRVNAVKTKLKTLGVTNKIEVSFFGKDESRDNIHEFARKVSLMIR